MVKVTFTFDERTVKRLREAATRLQKPQSHVVREAVREYADRIGKLSEKERQDLLTLFDRIVPSIPRRPLAEVEAELSELRLTRRRGERNSRSGSR